MLKMTCQLLFLGSPVRLAVIAHGLSIKYDWFPWLKRPLELGLSFREKGLWGLQDLVRACDRGTPHARPEKISRLFFQA